MRTYSSETASGLLSKGLEAPADTPGQAIVRTDDLFSDMILRAMEEPVFIDEIPEDFDEIRSVLVATVEHAGQRDDSPEIRACVSKKIPIIIEDHPEWSREQQVAVAFSLCRKDPEAYEKSVEYEMAEIERLGVDLAEAEARGDEVAVAGLRYALAMADAALEIAEQEAVGKGGAPKAAIQAAAAQWEEEKHPRKGGKFAPKGQGDFGAQAQPGAKPQAKPQAQTPAQVPQQDAAPQAPPSPQAAQRPAGRLQQVDMDRVKGAVDTARQALAARVQEARKKPAPPQPRAPTEQTMKPGASGYERFQEEASAAKREREEPKPKEPKAKGTTGERGGSAPYKNLAEFKATMERARAAGVKRDKLKEFMTLPREKREGMLRAAEKRKGTGTKEYKPKPKAEKPAASAPKPSAPPKAEEKKPEPKAEDEGLQAARKRAEAAGMSAEDQQAALKLPPLLRDVLISDAEKKKYQAGEQAVAAKPKAEEKKEPPKPAPKPEAPKERPKAEAPTKKPEKKPEAKPEPRRPSPAQEAARFEAEERRKKAEGGKKKEPTKTEEARRDAARARGGQAFPAGYKFDEDPVAIIERSIEVMLKADVETLKSATHSLVSKHGW